MGSKDDSKFESRMSDYRFQSKDVDTAAVASSDSKARLHDQSASQPSMARLEMDMQVMASIGKKAKGKMKTQLRPISYLDVK